MMLKITKTGESERDVLLMLEGTVSQEWAVLLDEVCRAYLREKKAVQLDCAHVDYADAKGVAVLRNFPRKRVTLMSAPGFITHLLQGGDRP